MTSIALASGAAFLFGRALVLAQFGLRDVPPLAGAAISIPSSTLLFACVTPIALREATIAWEAVPPRLALAVAPTVAGVALLIAG